MASVAIRLLENHRDEPQQTGQPDNENACRDGYAHWNPRINFDRHLGVADWLWRDVTIAVFADLGVRLNEFGTEWALPQRINCLSHYGGGNQQTAADHQQDPSPLNLDGLHEDIGQTAKWISGQLRLHVRLHVGKLQPDIDKRKDDHRKGSEPRREQPLETMPHDEQERDQCQKKNDRAVPLAVLEVVDRSNDRNAQDRNEYTDSENQRADQTKNT